MSKIISAGRLATLSQWRSSDVILHLSHFIGGIKDE